MSKFNALEYSVLKMLLDGSGELLKELRQQLEGASVAQRELTGVGFFTDITVQGLGNKPNKRTNQSGTIGDVVAEIEGLEHGAGFVLFVENGVLAMLEGYTYDESWPERPSAFTLRYASPNRDFGDLALF